MDATLPQMESFAFDKLDPVALEQTLEWFRQNSEACLGDYDGIGPGMYTKMLEEDGGVHDWMMKDGMGVGLQLAAEESGQPVATSTPTVDMEQSPPNTALQSNARTPAIVIQCTWEGCENSFPPTESLTAHLESHVPEATEHWAGLSRCMWSGCRSKAAFKTIAAYKKHLKNIHTHPLICTEAKCSHKQPFRNIHDLERHHTTIHQEIGKFSCPYQSCPSENQEFKRRDKLLLHIQNIVHDGDIYCPYGHCRVKQFHTASPFKTRAEITQHLREAHIAIVGKEFRCALGSCGSSHYGPGNFWTRWGLVTHLEDCHGIDRYGWTVMSCEDDGSRTLSSAHLGHLLWHDCNICAPQVQAPAHDGEFLSG